MVAKPDTALVKMTPHSLQCNDSITRDCRLIVSRAKREHTDKSKPKQRTGPVTRGEERIGNHLKEECGSANDLVHGKEELPLL